jgi:hypothetical protein
VVTLRGTSLVRGPLKGGYAVYCNNHLAQQYGQPLDVTGKSPFSWFLEFSSKQKKMNLGGKKGDDIYKAYLWA